MYMIMFVLDNPDQLDKVLEAVRLGAFNMAVGNLFGSNTRWIYNRCKRMRSRSKRKVVGIGWALPCRLPLVYGWAER